MLELTPEQHQALVTNGTEPVRAIDPTTQVEYVLVRAAVYDRIKGLLYDDGDWTPEEQLRLLAESGNRAGWNDPEMDVYDNYEENLKKLCQ